MRARKSSRQADPRAPAFTTNNQRHIYPPRGDGRRRMAKMHKERRSANMGAIKITWLDPEVFCNFGWAKARAEQPFNIREVQSRIGQCVQRCLALKLKRRLIWHNANLVRFRDTDNGRLA